MTGVQTCALPISEVHHRPHESPWSMRTPLILLSIGAIASVAMLLRHGLGLAEAADRVQQAIAAVLDAGGRTSDIARPGEPTLTTGEMGEEIAQRVASRILSHQSSANALQVVPSSRPPTTSLG